MILGSFAANAMDWPVNFAGYGSPYITTENERVGIVLNYLGSSGLAAHVSHADTITANWGDGYRSIYTMNKPPGQTMSVGETSSPVYVRLLQAGEPQPYGSRCHGNTITTLTGEWRTYEVTAAGTTTSETLFVITGAESNYVSGCEMTGG